MIQYVSYAACILAALAVSALCYMRHEARSLVLETVNLSNDINDCLRVIQISDLHVKFHTIPNKKIFNAVRGASPHAVILTGDYICSAKESGRFLTWMEGLIEAANGSAIYLCYGNHDESAFFRSPTLKRDLTKRLKKLGAYVMENRSATFTHNGRQYAVTGFADYYAAPEYDTGKILKNAPSADIHFHIGMSHNPDLVLDLADARPGNKRLIREHTENTHLADTHPTTTHTGGTHVKGNRPGILLFGHFHGGQIWLPFGLEYLCLRKERLCKMGVRRGLHDYGGQRLYISRGIGCVLFPLRLGSRPEITLFYLP